MKKKYCTLGCCGLDCGLCPRFYTDGASRCPGCCGDNFERLHPPCGFVTCCAVKRGLEACAFCGDFPCARFEKETGDTDSFITHRKVMYNQSFLKENGAEKFIALQERRMALLKSMLRDYDDGRCKSLFCLAAALLSIEALSGALLAAETEVKAGAVAADDKKSKAGLLKRLLGRAAEEENVELRLRKRN